MGELINAHQPARRILIIDDEVGVRDMLVFGLGRLGYQVDTAENGEIGIDRIAHTAYDLVVCDIMMPGKNGIDVLREVKRVHPQTEVVMATGYATVETAAESIQLGAYDYIAKPYGVEQLCTILDQAFHKTA